MPPAPSFRTTMYRPSKSVSMRELPAATTGESLKTPSAMHEVFDDGLCDGRGNRRAEAVRLLLDDDCDRDLRMARRRERREPRVVDGAVRLDLGSSRLPRDVETRREPDARGGAPLHDKA